MTAILPPKGLATDFEAMACKLLKKKTIIAFRLRRGDQAWCFGFDTPEMEWVRANWRDIVGRKLPLPEAVAIISIGLL